MTVKYSDDEINNAKKQLDELFPQFYEQKEFHERNFFFDFKYSSFILKKLIAIHSSRKEVERHTIYQLANCYQVLAGRLLLKNSVVFENEDKAKAIEYLLKAKEYMQRYYQHSLKADYDDERNWIEPESLFYLGDICQTLGMLADNENERNKYYQEALTNYIGLLNTRSGTNMRHPDLCKDRIKLMGLSPDLRHYSQSWIKIVEDHYPYALTVKFKKAETLRNETTDTLTTVIPSGGVVRLLFGFLKEDIEFPVDIAKSYVKARP